MGAICVILIGIVLDLYVIYLVIFHSPKPEKVPIISEREKYYTHMENLGLRDWEITIEYNKIPNYEALKRRNRRLEKALKSKQLI